MAWRYTIVSHRERSIEVHHRNDGEWTIERAESGHRVRVESIDCALEVDAVYHDPLGAS